MKKDKLKAENEDLKLEIKKYKNVIQDYESCREMGEKLNNELQIALKELLELLNQLEYFDDDDSDEWIRIIIRKAEALKEEKINAK